MRCSEARPLFSLYLDSAITGIEVRAISEHMRDCMECRLEYMKLEDTRHLVSGLGFKPAPPDLAYKIRLALCHERQRTRGNILRRYVFRLEYVFNSFSVPATAGILTAVFFFLILIGFFAPQPFGRGGTIVWRIFSLLGIGAFAGSAGQLLRRARSKPTNKEERRTENGPTPHFQRLLSAFSVTFVLDLLIPKKQRECLLGDLEEYRTNAIEKYGRAWANFLFWVQVLREIGCSVQLWRLTSIIRRVIGG